MKALEKDRTRRYETANGLARDIQRYLGRRNGRGTSAVRDLPPAKIRPPQQGASDRHRPATLGPGPWNRRNDRWHVVRAAGGAHGGGATQYRRRCPCRGRNGEGSEREGTQADRRRAATGRCRGKGGRATKGLRQAERGKGSGRERAQDEKRARRKRTNSCSRVRCKIGGRRTPPSRKEKNHVENERDQKERERKRADDERQRADAQAAEALTEKDRANQNAATAFAEKKRADAEAKTSRGATGGRQAQRLQGRPVAFHR